MSNHSKKTLFSSKFLICISAAVGAALIAVIVVAILVSRVKNSNNKNNNIITNVDNHLSASSNTSDSTNFEETTPNNQKPTIRGVENGKIYYTTQYINVIDDNLKTVTLNGDEYNADFFIEGNAENMYVIEAVDYDDNTLTYIVYTKTIKSLSDDINTISKYRVTLDDLEKIEYVKEMVINTGTKYSPPEETYALEEILTTCENLLDKINTIQEQVDLITTNYENPDYIASLQSNIQKLASSISEIDELLASYNLVQSQRTQLSVIRNQYSVWLSQASAIEPYY